MNIYTEPNYLPNLHWFKIARTILPDFKTRNNLYRILNGLENIIEVQL